MSESKVKKYIWPVSGIVLLLVILTVALLSTAVFSTVCDPDLTVDLFEIQEGSSFWEQTKSIDIFKVSYSSGGSITAEASDGTSKIIAPGTSGTYSFELKNNGGVAADYLLNATVEAIGLPEGTELPVEVTFRGPGGYFVGGEDSWESLSTLGGIEDAQTLDVSNSSPYTLEWRWPFEGNDELDTLLGNISAENPIRLTISFVVYSEYHPAEAAEPVFAPVPSKLNGINHLAYYVGDDQGMIRPNDDITRGQIAVIFYRMLKDSVKKKLDYNPDAFPDMPADPEFAKAVSALSELGIINGYPDGTFRPESPATRAEFVTMCSRFIENSVVVSRLRVKDTKDHWAEDNIKLCIQNGWVYGDDKKTFRPDDNVTRAEAAAVLNRMLHRMPRSINDLLPDMKRWPDNADENAWYFIDMQEASNSHKFVRLAGTYESWRSLL